MAAAQAGGDPSCVYHAVVAEDSTAEHVRQLIDDYAQGSEKRRRAAVNSKNVYGNETALEAAHRSGRGDLVGVLLENGANAKALGPYCSARALAILYGLPETLRLLMHENGRKANDWIPYAPLAPPEGAYIGFCRLVHLCVAPPCRHVGDMPPPQLECLNVLVREFGADVNAVDYSDLTPLHWVAVVAPQHRPRAADALLSLGADARRRGQSGKGPIFQPASTADVEVVRALLAHGASANERSESGFTPLMAACHNGDSNPAGFLATLALLLPASSRETRRARYGSDSSSALDLLASYRRPPFEPWKQQAIADLLAAGVPVRPENAPLVLPIAARLGERLAARAAALPPWWERHEMMVHLAFDVQDLRAAEKGVRVRERRVEELEEELRALGVGTEDTEDEEEETGEGEESGGAAAGR